MSIDDLAALVTGRPQPLFSADIQARREELADLLSDCRVLVIGGAGSIGAATIRALLSFWPRTLHVVDQSENNLAELVRDLRSGTPTLAVPDFRTLPLDFGSPAMERFLAEAEPYDFVLNFAALKHVRSEKDTYSLLQMLDTNLVKAARLLGWIHSYGVSTRYFAVSTDKAANPVNLMGASKRLMEHVIFSNTLAPGLRVTSARFANVAFSDGSLLDGFLHRLRKRQPLAAPRATSRYFVSPREAGQICLLATVCVPSGHLLIPRLDPASDLQELQETAAKILRHHGFAPRLYEEEATAKAGLEADIATGRYPLLLTPLDTSGEKPYEEFVGPGEQVVELGFANLLGLRYRSDDGADVGDFLREAEALLASPQRALDKDAIVRLVSGPVPQFRHVETGKSLDDRM